MTGTTRSTLGSSALVGEGVLRSTSVGLGVGLIERKRGQYFVSDDVAFSLALDD